MQLQSVVVSTYLSGLTGPFNASVTRYRFRKGVFSSIVTRNIPPFQKWTKSNQLNRIDKKYKNIYFFLTWTPSTLSTKKWPLFLLIKSAVIESEYEFNVAGTSSYGELLCSILRHRLIFWKKKNLKKLNKFLLWEQNCDFHIEMWNRYIPTKTALVACFKIISINSDYTC